MKKDNITLWVISALIALTAFAIAVPVVSNAQVFRILPGNQGGTGYATTSAADIGKCLSVASISPLRYIFDTCAGGSGGGGGFPVYVQNGGATLNTASTTLNFTSNSFSLTEDPTDTFAIRVATTTLGLLTTNVAEGSNLYYTDARVSSYMSASSTYTNLISFYTTPSTRITAGTGIDWSGNTLNGVYTAGDGITLNTEDFDCDTASGSTFGCLSATDWNTFNNKGVSNWLYNGSRLSPSTTVGIGVFASSTIGNGTATGGLTINGGATTTKTLMVDGGLGAADNARVWLKSFQEWTSPTHLGDLIRLQPMNDYWKAAISFTDKDGNNKTSLVAHDYLSSYSAALDKTFTTTDINSTTDVITLTAHGWATGDAVWFGASTFKTVDFPDGIYPMTRYFIRSVDANTIAVYRSSADATADTNRLPLENGSALATFTITKNNWHHHTSIESSDRSGTLGADNSLHSRLLFTYDYYPMPTMFSDAQVQISGSDLTLFTDPTSNQNVYFGVGRDDAGRRFSFQRSGSTGEFRIATFGSDGLNGGIAGLRMSSTTGNIGILGAPNTNTALSVTGSSTVSGSGYFGSQLTVNGSGFFGTSGTSEALIMARTNAAATDIGGSLRLTGESNGFTTYRGGFLRYDPLNNYLFLGTHDTADSATSSDLNSIRFARTTGNVDILKDTTLTNATATNIAATTGVNLFGGGYVTTANALCIQLTGSADPCDGVDGGGGVSDWVKNAALDAITPTTTVGIVVNASSSISELNTNSLRVTGDTVTDLTGFGMTVGSGALGLLQTGAADGECLVYESTGPTIDWASCGGGSSKWTDGTNFTYLTQTTYDLALGSSATTTAPFWWDVSSAQQHIKNPGAGDSTITFGATGAEWTIGFDDTDDTFSISSSTSLGTFDFLKFTSTSTLTYNATSSTSIVRGASMVFNGLPKFYETSGPSNGSFTNGMDDSSYMYFKCDAQTMNTQATAETIGHRCGDFAYFEDASGNTSAPASDFYGGLNLPVIALLDSTTANSGAGFFLEYSGSPFMPLASTTPRFSGLVRVNNGASTTVYAGFTNTSPAGTTYEVMPTAFVGFIATSTYANWTATIRTSASASTSVDTGVPSTTPLFFDIQTDAGYAYLWFGSDTLKKRLAMPPVSFTAIKNTGVAPGVYFGRGSGGSTVTQVTFQYLEYWKKKPYMYYNY